MGWTGVRAQKGVSRLNMLASCSSFSIGKSWRSSDATIEVEDLKSGPGGVYGILRKTFDATGDVVRFALVVLTETAKGEFLYKEMTEFEGPNETRYPAAFLKRLSAPEELASGQSLEHIRDWRKRVELEAQRREKLADIGPGAEITFSEPVSFSLNGEKVPVSRFKVLEWGRRKVFMAYPEASDSFRCRLSRDVWDYREYRVSA